MGEFTLHLDQVGSTLVDIWSLGLEDVVQRLGLQTALRDSEVDECRPAANIWCEHCRGIAGGQVQLERRREIDVLSAKLDENTTTGLLVLLVEHLVEDRVDVLGVLDEDWVTETKGTLKLLDKGAVQEAGHREAAFLAFRGTGWRGVWSAR